MAFPVALKCHVIYGADITQDLKDLLEEDDLAIVLDSNDPHWWIVVPATFISVASLFCIEEVGVLIEEPFPMLALDAICNKVNNNIQEAVTLEAMITGQLLAKQKSPTDERSSNGRLNS
ncbi:hypothetical protein IFM89_035202 [Coptis chinensis]|uniref:Uncharacterized protein n=1 Tax=Coptis chinensis TaxID=261450 RepID=A0A835M2I4_9MAGN|nr:hypothetical protein IFM89_035202 [Coptis chinensis]